MHERGPSAHPPDPLAALKALVDTAAAPTTNPDPAMVGTAVTVPV
jgi:hypothetical protein